MAAHNLRLGPRRTAVPKAIFANLHVRCKSKRSETPIMLRFEVGRRRGRGERRAASACLVGTAGEEATAVCARAGGKQY